MPPLDWVQIKRWPHFYEDVKQLEPTNIVCGKRKWENDFQGVWQFCKKKAGIAFSYDPVILILSKRCESICSQKDMYMNIYSSCVYNNQSGNNPSDHQQVNAN